MLEINQVPDDGRKENEASLEMGNVEGTAGTTSVLVNLDPQVLDATVENPAK